ncbi:MAG: hypothetical protein ACJA2G_002734 [Cognaticolwellia sp.]|jgi:hypothetical protein
MNLAVSNTSQGQGATFDKDLNKEHLESKLVHVHEALRRGLSARNRMTSNNPATSGGQYFYSEVVRALRELLMPFGYKKESIRNVELTINDSQGLAIYLCSGCDQTGNLAGVPQSITDKGDFTLDLFQLKYDDAPNLDLFPELLPQARPNNKLNCDIWFLIHHFDKANNTVSAELARPVSYNKNGYVTGFDPDSRIIIDINNDDVIETESDFNNEIDFDIEEL